MENQDFDENSKAFFSIMLQKFTEGHYNALLDPRMTCIYALEMSNATVKIGKTQNLEKRIRRISNGSGLEVVNYYHTEYVHHSTAAKIETSCHKTFDTWRIKGEFFEITFAEACAELDKYAEEITEANRKFTEEIAPAIQKEYDAYLESIRKTESYSLPKKEKVETEMKPQIVIQNQTPKLYVLLDDVKKSCKLVEEIFSIKSEMAISKSIAIVERFNGVELPELKSLIPPAEYDVANMTPTQIGQLIGKSAQYVNKKLIARGLQIRDKSGKYILTEAGKEFGALFFYEKNGHTINQIKWCYSVINMI